MIRNATKEDESWVKSIFNNYKEYLGGFGPVWFRYWQANNDREFWKVIEGKAFAHYLVKKNGETTLYEIAVSPREARQGYGKQLIASMPSPIELKTDDFNGVSNAFYKNLGFIMIGKKKSKSGKRLFHLWKKF